MKVQMHWLDIVSCKFHDAEVDFETNVIKVSHDGLVITSKRTIQSEDGLYPPTFETITITLTRRQAAALAGTMLGRLLREI